MRRLKNRMLSPIVFDRPPLPPPAPPPPPPPPPPPSAPELAPWPELEDAGVLEEEVALLGEQQVEAGQVDLLLVGLDL